MRVPKLLLTAVALSLVAAAPAGAHHGVSVNVIAKKLDNPRHVAVARNGDVYVAEAGKGGDHATSKSCFDSAEGFACTGATGAVTTRVRRSTRKLQQDRVSSSSLASLRARERMRARSARTASSCAAATCTSPTAARPEPTRGGQPVVVLRDPTLVVRGADLGALYGTLLKLGKHQRVELSSPTSGASSATTTPTPRSATRHIDSNPVDVYADRGTASSSPTPAATRCCASVQAAVAISVVSVFPNIDRPARATRRSRCRRSRRASWPGRDGDVLRQPAHGLPVPDRRREDLPRRPADRRVHDLRVRLHERDGPRLRARRHAVRARDRPRLAVPAGRPEHRGRDLRGPARRRQADSAIEVPAGKLVEPGGLAVAGRKTLVVSNHAREAGVRRAAGGDAGSLNCSWRSSDKVATFTLNRPERLNAVTPQMVRRARRGTRRRDRRRRGPRDPPAAERAARSAPGTTSSGRRG